MKLRLGLRHKLHNARVGISVLIVAGGYLATSLFNAPAAAVSAKTSDQPSGFVIHVAPTGWGDANVADIQAVLESAAAKELNGVVVPKTVINVQNGTEPLTAFVRDPNGAFVVTLAVSGRQWAQFAYQFSHELCHVVSLNQRAVQTSTDWFEESMCEAVSIETVRRMGVVWKTKPPYPNWKSYASSLDEYWREVVSRPSRQLPANDTITNWYVCRASAFAANSTDREANGMIANELIKTLRSEPKAIRTLSSMNQTKIDSTRTMANFVDNWQSAERSRPNREIIKKLSAPFVANSKCQTKAG
jgi:hypothetical protein